jgi:hypothetical protein
VRAWLEYAVASLLLAAVVWVVVQFVGGPGVRALRMAIGLACAVQLIAFGVLVGVRERRSLFVAGMVGGMLFRLRVVAGTAFWVLRTGALPAATLLLSLVGFLFLLVMLEPLFLRKGLGAK